MDVKTWTYLIVGITFVAYIGIAIWSKAKSTKEFYVAGGGVSPIANGMATACLLYTSPSPRDQRGSRMPSSA